MGRRPALFVATIFCTTLAVTWYRRDSQQVASAMKQRADTMLLDVHTASFEEEFDPSNCRILSTVAPHSGAIFRTGGLSQEGFGSFVQQLKLSAVAAIYLNKTLIIDQSYPSEHGYNVPELINEASNYTSDGSERCQVTLTEEIAQSMCAHMVSKSYNESVLQTFMRNASCTELKQHKDKYIPYEMYNDCIQPWLQDAFRGMFARRQFSYALQRKQCLNVGIHIRFGDLKTTNLRELDGRSMQLTEINIAVNNLNKISDICYNFYIFAKNSTEDLKAQFQFDHKFVDSSDDLYDVYVYTLMDIYIQGSSSFCVISSLIEPDKTIITNRPGYKYTFDYKQVSRVYHFKDNAAAYMDDIRNRQPDYFRHACNTHFARKAAESGAQVATGKQ